MNPKNEPMTRGQFEQVVIEKALREPAFKTALMADAPAAIEREFGVCVPEGVAIRVLEETPETRYLVLPQVGFETPSGELDDAALGNVAGGLILSTTYVAPSLRLQPTPILTSSYSFLGGVRVTQHSTEQCDIC